MTNEPVVTVAAITALVVAFLGLLTAFGLPVTRVQTEAILVFVGTAAPLVAAYFQRRRVTPVHDARPQPPPG